jgi:prepilin-type N-terminal cleavage/methylation domain-containing protein/prepilin-type processing-associated H-X9-DG protein
MSTTTAIRRHSRDAFTLVELLVVIAIIGTLVALLIPAVQAARATARQAQCMNNLSQLGKAMINYETSKSRLPGYAQLVKRDNKNWVTAAFNAAAGGIVVDNALDNTPPIEPPATAWDISWAAVILPHMERQDIWDRIVDVKSTQSLPAAEQSGLFEVIPIESFICPSDTDVTSNPDLPGLTYSANTGSWDYDNVGTPAAFLFPPNRGDTVDNGIFMNLAAFERNNQKAPQMRISKIRDGANMTIMLSENINKSYEAPPSASGAYFTWLGGANITGGNIPEFGTEQQLGFIWVVNVDPQAGATITSQERINRDSTSPPNWDAQFTNFARPASGHSGGVNVVFADTHTQFLREDIDYLVYQRLMTPNSKKVVDPDNWDAGVNPVIPTSPIQIFRRAPVLSETDYQ